MVNKLEFILSAFSSSLCLIFLDLSAIITSRSGIRESTGSESDVFNINREKRIQKIFFPPRRGKKKRERTNERENEMEETNNFESKKKNPKKCRKGKKKRNLERVARKDLRRRERGREMGLRSQWERRRRPSREKERGEREISNLRFVKFAN